MKKLILAVLLATMGFGPAFASSVYVYLGARGSDKERIGGIDLNALSLCAFKAQMAARYDLDARKFDVKLSSRVLSDEGSMWEAGVRQNANVLLVPRTSNSQQC